MTYYQRAIKEYCEKKHPNLRIDPRHIEANMRLAYGTLDGLSREQFNAEIENGIAFVKIAGVKAAEDMAKSYGL